jgi:hypothetical protein
MKELSRLAPRRSATGVAGRAIAVAGRGARAGAGRAPSLRGLPEGLA